ncbi:hypothetical protein, partial [Geothermobacter hydrogeniphilus]|uniref:hypothetical protein n=1 Tax=Geothermobacter hydrogeniphilus TaxID=1969733 RepID=UPI001E33BE3A
MNIFRLFTYSDDTLKATNTPLRNMSQEEMAFEITLDKLALMPQGAGFFINLNLMKWSPPLPKSASMRH